MRRPVSVRWSETELTLLEEAAGVLGVTRAAFARSSAVRAARCILEGGFFHDGSRSVKGDSSRSGARQPSATDDCIRDTLRQGEAERLALNVGDVEEEADGDPVDPGIGGNPRSDVRPTTTIRIATGGESRGTRSPHGSGRRAVRCVPHDVPVSTRLRPPHIGMAPVGWTTTKARA